MTEINSIIVFGATGIVGLQALKRGILEGLEVSAYVRKPQKIPSTISSKLHRVIQGDVLDKERVADAVEGHDAVINALGTQWKCGKSSIISEGCENIVAAMKKHNVTKLVVVSIYSLLPGRKNSFLYRKFSDDHAKQLAILREETGSIEWIAMMAPRIKDSTYIDEDYKVEKNNIPGADVVTSAELADFMVKVFMDRTSTECFKHCQIGISSHPKITSTREFKIVILSAAVVILGITVLYYGWLPSILQDYLNEVFH